MTTNTRTSKHIYRVDKFIVPDEARDELLDKTRKTHEVLQKQPGFVQDFVLELASGPGEFNVVTFVEWENEAAIEGARAAVMALHRELGFSAPEVLERLGVRADLGLYTRVNEEATATP